MPEDYPYTRWQEIFISALRHLPAAKRKARRIAKRLRVPVEILYLPRRGPGGHWLLGVIYPDGHWSRP